MEASDGRGDGRVIVAAGFVEGEAMSLLSVIQRGAGGLGLSTTVKLPELPHDNILEDLVISARVESTAASAQMIVLANEESCEPEGPREETRMRRTVPSGRCEAVGLFALTWWSPEENGKHPWA